MNLTLIIIINVVLDTAIIGALTYVMSRSAGLTPHRPGDAVRVRRVRRPVQSSRRPRPERVGARRLGSALD